LLLVIGHAESRVKALAWLCTKQAAATPAGLGLIICALGRQLDQNMQVTFVKKFYGGEHLVLRVSLSGGTGREFQGWLVRAQLPGHDG
jgi:hypothetical protein